VLPEDRFCEACGLELAPGWADPPLEVLAPELVAPEVVAPEHLPPEHLAPEHLPPEHLPPEHLPPEHLPPEHLPPEHLPPELVLPMAVAREDRSHIEMSLPDMAGVSDVGLRHQCNEDAMGLAKVGPPNARVLVVCDGVSTSSEPAAAAQAAADAALAYLVQAVQSTHLDAESAMTQAVGAAQRAVSAVQFSAAQADEPPATTLVAAVVMDHQTTIGWVGDSRAYLVGPDEAWQLSQDHTWATEQVEMGMMSDDAILADPRAHALTKWLGGDIEGGFEPSVATFAVPVNGCLVLCTDGLWNYAPSPERMCGLVAELPGDATPLEVAQGLTEFARSSGGSDNITVAVAFV